MKKPGLKGLSINQTLVISHFVLVLTIIFGMSLTRYQHEWTLHVDQAAQRANDVLLYHVKDLSLLVAGRNYSNLMLPAQVDAFHAHQNLIFLDIKGASNLQSHFVQVRYMRQGKRIWREDISLQEIEEFQGAIHRFEALLQQTADTDADRRAKLNYILQKARINHEEGQKSLAARQQFNGLWIEPDITEEAYYFDAEQYQLHMTLPLTNEQGGRLWGVFDVHELGSMRQSLLIDIIMEATLAILISFFLIIISTRKLVSPLKRLAEHMNKNIDEIKIEAIDERYRRDELGDLARSFVLLLSEVQYKVSDLKKKTYTDALTGLGSRHKYSQDAVVLLKNAVVSGKRFALLICDIDHFKSYNDSYGHSMGDSAIMAVSQAMSDAVSDAGRCYRIGGEEFAVLLEYGAEGESLALAERIRVSVEDLKIEHNGNFPYYIVSLSVGMCFIEPVPLLNHNISFSRLYSEMFNMADQQLYLAKSHGRNKVISSQLKHKAYRTLKVRAE